MNYEEEAKQLFEEQWANLGKSGQHVALDAAWLRSHDARHLRELAADEELMQMINSYGLIGWLIRKAEVLERG